MSYLRFAPGEYHAIRRLVQASPLREKSLSALKHFLVAYLPVNRLDLALRISRLNGSQMRILREHFLGRRRTDAPAGNGHSFSEEEFKLINRAVDFPDCPIRILRLCQRSVAERLSGDFPLLARKLARLSEREFGLLCEQAMARGKGSA